MKKSIFITTLILSVTHSGLYASQHLNLERLLRQAPYRSVRYSIMVEKIAPTREVVFAYNENRLLIPASIMKVVVTAAALDYYGPNYKFKTEILASKKPNWNGIINGNIYIKGWGDPGLTHEDIEDAGVFLSKTGIKMVQGNVAYDDSFFDREEPKPNLIKKFYAPPSALCINRNTISCVITDTHPRRLAPSVTTAYIKFNTSRVRVSSSKEIGYVNARYQANGVGDTYTLSGTATEGSVAKNMLTYLVSNPALYAATLFKESLLRNGIESNRIIDSEAPKKAVSLYIIEGHPLKGILETMNHDSDNVIAETLNKGLGAHLYSAPGTREKGARYLKSFVEKNIPGTESWIIRDGSGLSPENQISARGMNGILKWTYNHHNLREAMIDSLARQGFTDHYKDFTPDEKFVVLIKTGTLPQSGVNSSAGYIHNTETDEWYAYTIIANLPSKYALQRGRLTNPILKAICQQLDNRSNT